eukprot:10969180-Ditylum_brightwellii.AAC.1
MVHCSLSKGMSAGGMIKNIFNATAGLYKFYKYSVNDLDLSKLMLYLGWKRAVSVLQTKIGLPSLSTIKPHYKANELQ